MFTEKSQALFSMPKQACKMDPENDHVWFTTSYAFSTEVKEILLVFAVKPIAVLLIWPKLLCGTLPHWVDSQKHPTSSMTEAYNTHMYIFMTKRNISTGWKWWYQRVVQRWLIIPMFYGKLDFSLVPSSYTSVVLKLTSSCPFPSICGVRQIIPLPHYHYIILQRGH